MRIFTVSFLGHTVQEVNVLQKFQSSCSFRDLFYFNQLLYHFLQIYWSYIVGMLTNIGSLPLDRIHSMLKMFAMHGPSGSQCTQDDVKNFLQKKVQEGELQYSSGMYKLPRT